MSALEPIPVEMATTEPLLPDDMTHGQWLEMGGPIAHAYKRSSWWLGTWWNYGDRRWGTGPADADAIGVPYQTCRNAGSIAARFELSRRRDSLSFAHHAEVAALPEPEQEHLLDRAEAEGWRRERLRAEVQQRRRDIPAREVRPPQDIDPDPLAVDWQSADGRLQMLHGDFRDRLADVPDASVDLVLTDPPYPSTFTPLWSDLAEVAARVLGPRGLLIAYAPLFNLPEVHDRLREHLTFGWELALLLSGSNSRFMGRHMMRAWRPIVAYSTGTWPAGAWGTDVLTSPAPAKDNYRWEQSIEPAVELVERFCPLDGLVVDPFVGTGTFGAAAGNTGRRFIGCEMDGQRFADATRRLATVEPTAVNP